MKQPKKGGRLLADIGDEKLKKTLYEILWKQDMNYTQWLKKTVKEYVDKYESEV